MSFPDDKEKLEDKIAKLYEMENLNDVSIKIIKGTDIKTFRANRYALSLSSSYFLAFFNSKNWIESHGELLIEDISPKTFEKFLKFVYYKPVEFTSVKDAAELYTAADRFLAPRLQKYILSELEDNIKPANACFLYSFAQLYKLDKLLRKSLEIIKFRTDEILLCYKMLEFEDLLIILDQKFLNVSEFRLCLKIIDWVVYRNKIGDKIDEQDQSLLMSKISLSMNEKETETLARSPFLSPEEKQWIANCNYYPSHFTPWKREIAYLYSFSEDFPQVKEKLTRSAIVLRLNTDIVINCINMFTQEGDPSKKYMEDLTFILYRLGSIHDILKIHINQRLNHSSIFSIELGNMGLLRKNVDYWMAFIKEEKPDEESKLYNQTKLNGKVFIQIPPLFLNRHILVNYSPKLPVAGFEYSLVSDDDDDV